MSESHCPLCEQPNHCTGDTHCWCMTVTVDAQQRLKIPASSSPPRCLCPQCAQATDAATTPTANHD